MSFNLGTIKFKMQITSDGKCILSLDIIEDELSKMFPIKDNLTLGYSKVKYKRYVNNILKEKEEWIRNNIPSGIYTAIIRIAEDNLEKES